MVRLAHVENIIGVKEASGDLKQIARLIEEAPAGFRVWSGDDEMTLPILAVGGYGVISVTSHLVGSQVREMIGRSPVAGLKGALVAMKERADSTELLGGIDVPTLVVAGQEDELIPVSVARELTSAIPSAALTVIPGAGHVPSIESPTAVSRVFSEFLEAARVS